MQAMFSTGVYEMTQSNTPAPAGEGWSDEDDVPGIDAAVHALGTQAALADALGVSQQAVAKWRKRGFVPVERAVEVEQATGVPRARLLNPRVRELLDPGV